MRPRALAVALAAAWLLAPAAQAQFLAIFSGGTKVLAQFNGSGEATGGVTVRFAGDPQAGCADHGVCGLSGTVTWRPGTQVGLALLRVEHKGERGWWGAFTIGSGYGDSEVGVVTHRTGPSGERRTCLDAPSWPGTFARVQSGTDRIGIRLTGRRTGAVSIASRCGGPTLADIARAIPAARPAASALRAGTTLDFSGTRPFSGGGLSGTVTSDVVVTTGRLNRSREDQGADRPPQSFPTVSVTRRSVDVTYKVAAVEGELALTATGARDGVCAMLDSCGATSAMTFTPAAGGRAFVSASTEHPQARIPDLLAALSLGPATGHAPGIHFYGTGSLEQGALEQHLTHGDGAVCDDRTEDPSLSLGIGRGPAGLRLELRAGYADTVRTHCAGPMLADRVLARGLAPRGVLGERRPTLVLDAGNAFSDDGWRVRSRSTLRITLERVRVRPSSFESERLGP